MNLLVYNCLICMCFVFVIAASANAWNADYYNEDDAPHHLTDTSASSAAIVMGFVNTANHRHHHSFHHRSSCNCIKARDCKEITIKIQTASKPLTADFMKDIQKKAAACGFINNEPYICCPPPQSVINIFPRSFREVTSEKPWIWDIVNDTSANQAKNLFNRISVASIHTNAWAIFNYPRPNDFNTDALKPYASNNGRTRKNHFFDFEDPHTFRNCPPSQSPDFLIPSHFQHIKPIEYHHLPPIMMSTHAQNGFGSNKTAENDPSIVFPSRSNAVPDPTKVPLRGILNVPSAKLNLLNKDNCGISFGPRILGGQPSTPGQFPWMARIAYRNRTSQRVSYRCSGAVISDKYVLTAAHCVTNLVDDLELLYVRLGELDTRKNLCDNNRNLCSEPQDYEIESIVHHPGYDTPKYANDVALIRLRRTTNSTFISALCLPLENYEAIDKNLQQKTGIVVGWSVSKLGASSLPQYLQLPIVDTQSCADSYGRFSANSRTPIIINDTQLCVQGTTDRDTCQGDSGGPLMIEDKGRYILIGLVSFGPRSCGISNFPGVFSRTSSYVKWILNNMQL